MEAFLKSNLWEKKLGEGMNEHKRCFRLLF